MGGLVGLTIRDEQRNVKKMSTYTNWVSAMLNNLRLVEKSPEHLAAIVAPWEVNQLKPPAERHFAYIHDLLAPRAYGLIVIDLATNRILDYNGYSRVGGWHLVSIATSRASISRGGSYSTADLFEEFRAVGRIRRLKIYKADLKQYHDYPRDINTMSKVALRRLIASNSPEMLAGFFELNMSPFEVTRFPETVEGLVSYRQQLLDLGFELTPADEAGWAAYIQQCRDYDAAYDDCDGD